MSGNIEEILSLLRGRLLNPYKEDGAYRFGSRLIEGVITEWHNCYIIVADSHPLDKATRCALCRRIPCNLDQLHADLNALEAASFRWKLQHRGVWSRWELPEFPNDWDIINEVGRIPKRRNRKEN